MKSLIYVFFLATIDVKKSIYDIAIDRFDTQIALVENQGMYNSVQESVVRVYDVGRRRDDEDEQVQTRLILFEDSQKLCSSVSLIRELETIWNSSFRILRLRFGI